MGREREIVRRRDLAISANDGLGSNRYRMHLRWWVLDTPAASYLKCFTLYFLAASVNHDMNTFFQTCTYTYVVHLNNYECGVHMELN